METRNILSRRSMLKASAFLAVASATPVLSAHGEEAIPAVLSMLLTEYDAAHRALAEAREAYSDAERKFDLTLNKARLYIPQQCGDGYRAAWLGHLYSGSADPWTAKHRLKNYRDDTMARARESGDAGLIAETRRTNRNLSQQLSRQFKRYEAIKTAAGLPSLDDARTTTYWRSCDANEALEAYRPTTFAELREIVRVVRQAPRYGSGLEWLLVSMLEIEPGKVA